MGEQRDDTNMKKKTRVLFRAATCAALAIAAGILWPPSSLAQGGVPKYEVDLSWPKPLPDRWVLGGLGGGCVDAQDHVLVLDRQNGDVYVSDGESRGGNRRVAVMDRNGKFLRQWQPDGMQTVHCMTVANDGLVYVCNREGSRIQVYDKMGHFIKNIEVPWKPYTPPADGKPKE